MLSALPWERFCRSRRRDCPTRVASAPSVPLTTCNLSTTLPTTYDTGTEAPSASAAAIMAARPEPETLSTGCAPVVTVRRRSPAVPVTSANAGTIHQRTGSTPAHGTHRGTGLHEPLPLHHHLLTSRQTSTEGGDRASGVPPWNSSGDQHIISTTSNTR